GQGFSETSSVALTVRDGERVESTLRLPERVRALRLDPLTAPGRFVLRDVVVRELGTAQLAASLWNRARAASPVGGLWERVPRAFAVVRAQGVRALARRMLAHEPEATNYPEWVRTYDTLTDGDRALIRRHVEALSHTPLVSIVMPTYETPERWLRR